MASKTRIPPATPASRGQESAAARKERLAAELRSNLAKRKAQARARGRGPAAPDELGDPDGTGRPDEVAS